jgi:hypothetical protein
MKLLLTIYCLTVSALQIHGQINESKIDKKDLKKFIRILASDSLEGRETGSNGQRKAEKFISERFKELGLQTFDQGEYLEKFKLTQTYWGQVYLKTKSKTLKNFESIVLQGSNAQNDEIEKEVIFGGLGTEEELSPLNVEGRLVLVFVKNLRATYDVGSLLEKRNAYGVIVANPANDNQFESIKRTFKDYYLQKRLFIQQDDTVKSFLFAKLGRMINTISISNSEIVDIMGLTTKQLVKSIEAKKISEITIAKVKVKFEKVQNEIETANVIGLLHGKSNKTIVVSAHYDHLGKLDNEYFPGGDDNASGTAALIELAEEFSNNKNLEHNIMFLATSAEEAGLLGSFYHVNSPKFNSANIICDLNLDMISRIDDKHTNGKYLYCIGTDQSVALDSLIKKADSLYDKCSFDFSLNNSKDPTGLFTRSDNYNFSKKGIPSIQFFSGLHQDYHKPTDTADKIDYANLESRVRQISVVIELLQSEGLKN